MRCVASISRSIHLDRAASAAAPGCLAELTAGEMQTEITGGGAILVCLVLATGVPPLG
jgi:hypothetical protein